MYVNEFLGDVEPQTLIGEKFYYNKGIHYIIKDVKDNMVYCKCLINEKYDVVLPLEPWIFQVVHNGKQFPMFSLDKQFEHEFRGELCLVEVINLLSEDYNKITHSNINIEEVNNILTEIYNNKELRDEIIRLVPKKKNGEFSSKGVYEIKAITDLTPNKYHSRSYLAVVSYGSNKSNNNHWQVSIRICTMQKPYKKKEKTDI